jgi:hypothetical protein
MDFSVHYCGVSSKHNEKKCEVSCYLTTEFIQYPDKKIFTPTKMKEKVLIRLLVRLKLALFLLLLVFHLQQYYSSKRSKVRPLVEKKNANIVETENELITIHIHR